VVRPPALLDWTEHWFLFRGAPQTLPFFFFYAFPMEGFWKSLHPVRFFPGFKPILFLFYLLLFIFFPRVVVLELIPWAATRVGAIVSLFLESSPFS